MVVKFPDGELAAEVRVPNPQDTTVLDSDIGHQYSFSLSI